MRHLKLSGLIRRNPDRPSLKERAAALRATAAKVMRRPVFSTAGRSERRPAPDLPATGRAVSTDLQRAIETHREAVQMAVRDPDADRGEVHRIRIRALAEAVHEIPARSPADLRLKVLYLWPGNIEGKTVDEDLSETLLSFRSDVMRLGAEPDDSDDDAPVFQTVRLQPVADLLSNAILKEWAAQAVLSDDETLEAEAANERALDRRHRLIVAAERLPARRESLTAKALALAWISYADLWRKWWERSDYTTDGRLALDIDAIATGSDTRPETPDAALLPLGDELVVAWADEIDPAHDETRFEAATARSSAIVDQIEALTPATLDGLIVKAVAVSWCHCGDAVTGECFDEQPTTDLNLCAAIVRDLLAMRAGPPLPQPKGA